MSLMGKLLFLLGVAIGALAEGRKILLILGPPCAGCGTQSPSIVNALGIPHLDTGEMLRQAALAGTPVGKIAGEMMAKGVLVTDSIVEQIVKDGIAQPDCDKGFLLDGFPRNVVQSKVLDSILAKNGESVTDVLVLNVPYHALQQCVTHRWTADGGDAWTSDYLAMRVPKSFKKLPLGTEAQCQRDDLEHCNMWDDWTGEPLFRRADDNLKALAERVKLYHSQTDPVIKHYEALGAVRHIDGYQPEPKVWEDIAHVIGADPSKGLAAVPKKIKVEAATVLGLLLVSTVTFSIAIAVSVRGQQRNDSDYLLVK